MEWFTQHDHHYWTRNLHLRKMEVQSRWRQEVMVARGGFRIDCQEPILSPSDAQYCAKALLDVADMRFKLALYPLLVSLQQLEGRLRLCESLGLR